MLMAFALHTIYLFFVVYSDERVCMYMCITCCWMKFLICFNVENITTKPDKVASQSGFHLCSKVSYKTTTLIFIK